MISARLIQSGYCDAATNMAIDEAIFLSYREKSSVPTLRLYGWKPAAISVGHSQNPEELLNRQACQKDSVDIVRRPTGGGILLHDRELTYSVVLAQSDIGLTWRVKESFEAITSFLLEAYKNLGARACFAKDVLHTPAPGRLIAPFCFSRNEEYDILVNGKKLGGNAQKRRRQIILQHGSLPLSFDKQKAERFLKDTGISKNMDITTIHEVSQHKMDFEKLSEILIKAFSCHFKTVLTESSLTPEETRLASELKDQKYLRSDWTLYESGTSSRVA